MARKPEEQTLYLPATGMPLKNDNRTICRILPESSHVAWLHPGLMSDTPVYLSLAQRSNDGINTPRICEYIRSFKLRLTCNAIVIYGTTLSLLKEQLMCTWASCLPFLRAWLLLNVSPSFVPLEPHSRSRLGLLKSRQHSSNGAPFVIHPPSQSLAAEPQGATSK